MDNRCRTCLRVPTIPTPLYENPNLIEKIQEIASIQIIQDENYPSSICHECLTNVNTLYNFRKVIIHNEKELRECRATLERSCEILLQESEVKDEDLSENPNGHLDPLCTLFEPENEIMTTPQVLNKLYPCGSCDMRFSSRGEVKLHRERIHYPRTLCNVCGITCRTANLKKHQLTHFDSNVTCEICGKVLKNSETLRGHMFIHKGIEYICHICGKVVKIRQEYQRHVKSHSDPNAGKSKCKICGKFVWGLKKHYNSHTGERPHICCFCKKGFSSPYALTVHKRQHTKEKPYKCSHCSMAFPQGVSLRTHIKLKHGAT